MLQSYKQPPQIELISTRNVSLAAYGSFETMFEHFNTLDSSWKLGFLSFLTVRFHYRTSQNQSAKLHLSCTRCETSITPNYSNHLLCIPLFKLFGWSAMANYQLHNWMQFFTCLHSRCPLRLIIKSATFCHRIKTRIAWTFDHWFYDIQVILGTSHLHRVLSFAARKPISNKKLTPQCYIS